MPGWQRGLVAPLTKKYWASDYDRELGPNLEFADDQVVDDFWRTLDAERFEERFLLAADDQLPTKKLIATAMRRAQSLRRSSKASRALHSIIHHETLHGLFHLESGAQISPGGRLEDYSVEDGDHLGLIIEHKPKGLYSLIPLPDSEMVFAAIRSADETPPESATGALKGALLYTDEDVEIATYVRKHFASISEASGPNLHFYVIEQPEKDWREASRYWKGIVDEQLQREWATLGWLRTKPYRPEETYEVARQLGVYPDEMPCLVLFEKASEASKLVFPILDGTAHSFRALFSCLQRLIVDGASNEISFAGVRRDYPAILSMLEAEAEKKATDDRAVYTFEGQTVFINKPAGDVTLSDFQKMSMKDEDRQR